MKLAIVVAFILAAAIAGVGQDTPPAAAPSADTKPPVGAASPAQRKLLTGDLAIAKLAQIEFQNSIAQLQADADAVKRENGWPAATPFCMDTLAFTACPVATVAPVAMPAPTPNPTKPSVKK